MASCHEMKLGQVYVCEECGLELKVVKECTDHESEEACACEMESGFQCCGGPLKLREE